MSLLFDGTNHPSADQVINAGCVGALMYGGTPQYSKNFTPAQYRDYKARNLLTMFAFEIDANDMNGGQAAGAAHAASLLANLRSGGVANTEPVCATVDKHVTAANIPLAVAYQRGFYQYVKGNGWPGPDGGYGFSEFLIAIHDAGVADWYWGAGNRSTMPPYTNVWQDNTGTINVGGSADDLDWILVPLPPGGHTMDWSDPLPNPLYDKTITDPADVRSHPAYTVAQYIQGPWVRTLTVQSTEAQILAGINALAAEDSAHAAAILAATQTADTDIKAAQAAIAALPAPGQVTEAQMADLEAKLIAAYPNYTVSITKAVP